MKAGQVVEQNVPVQLSLRIAKVDKATREVEGICTQEVRDVHGEIVDHESMKGVLLDWPGNIREMHQPIAVGKAVQTVSDDDAKATILRARVSKGAPDTWLKVEDGTLSMFSIGGSAKRVTTKHADGTEEKRLFMTKLHEISLVDNGACPTAKFDIVKSVDGQAVECQPEEPAAAEATAKTVLVVSPRAGLLTLLAKVAGELAATPTAHGAATVAVTKLEAIAEDAVTKKAYPTPYMIERTLGAIALLEGILADEWWKVLDLENYDQEGDHGADRAQVQVLRSAIELVMAYLLSEFNAQFADFDAEPAVDAGVEMVARGAKAVGVELEKRGARHSKADITMIQALHDNATKLGAACAQPAEKAVDVVVALDGQAIVRAAAAASTETPAPPAVPETPAAPEAPVQQAAGLTLESVQKLVTDAVTQAVEAHKATSETTIAELQAQITKLANEPMPGGPVTRAVPEGTPVHKTVGGNAGEVNLEGLDMATITEFAKGLAAEAKTEEERQRIVTNLLKFQHRTGAGAAVFSQKSARTFTAQEPPSGQ